MSADVNNHTIYENTIHDENNILYHIKIKKSDEKNSISLEATKESSFITFMANYSFNELICMDLFTFDQSINDIFDGIKILIESAGYRLYDSTERQTKILFFILKDIGTRRTVQSEFKLIPSQSDISLILINFCAKIERECSDPMNANREIEVLKSGFSTLKNSLLEIQSSERETKNKEIYKYKLLLRRYKILLRRQKKDIKQVSQIQLKALFSSFFLH